MSVKCGKVVYVYLYNNSDKALQDAELTVNLGCSGSYTIETFDPGTCVSATHGELPTPGRFVLGKIALSPRAERIYVFTPKSAN